MMENMENQSIKIVEPSDESLLLNPDKIGRHIAVWERTKSALAEGGGRIFIEGTPYINKKGWRLIALACQLKIEILEQQKILSRDDIGEYYVWIFKARATAPNGRFAEAYGACSSRKPFFAKRGGEFREQHEIREEDIILTAQTVAINRAISDLVGGGEVSAEEMDGAVNVERQKDTAAATQKQINYVKGLIAKKKIPPEQLETILRSCGAQSLETASRQQVSDIIGKIEEL